MKETQMNRMQTIAKRPKRTLAVLATVLVAVGVAIGSGAAFTAQTANAGNAFTAGTLSMTNDKDPAAILTASNMKPGDVSTGLVDIQNTGSLSGVFTVTRTALTDSDATFPMSAKLNLVIKDCGDFSAGAPTCDAGDPTKYTGTLGAMSGAQALSTYAANEKHRYEFTVTFDASSNNNYQGDNSTATFTWDAS